MTALTRATKMGLEYLGGRRQIARANPEAPWRVQRAKRRRKGYCGAQFCRGKTLKRDLYCTRCAHAAWRANNPARAAFIQLRNHAKARGIAFSLTMTEFNEILDCQKYVDRRGKTRTAYHIDRIDSEQGYHADNVQVMTSSENSLKSQAERRRACTKAPPILDDDPPYVDDHEPF